MPPSEASGATPVASDPSVALEDATLTEQQQAAAAAKSHDAKGAADLERVTDYFEEKELSGAAASLGSLGIEEAMKALSEKVAKERETKMAYDKELKKVPIQKEHVELIMKELEMSKPDSERALRENGGDPVKTLIALMNV